MAVFDKSGNAGFEALTATPPKLPLADKIPKIAHFVITKVRERHWFHYATIRGALEWLDVEKINIWAPEGEELPGPIWEHILKLPKVQVRRITIPRKVFGQEVEKPAHRSDLIRLKALYEEGGELLGCRNLLSLMDRYPRRLHYADHHH